MSASRRRLCHDLRLAMRAAERLGNDFIEQVELRSRSAVMPIASAASSRRSGSSTRMRCAALRRDHRIDAVLHHQEAVADADRERAAGAALADHAAHDRHREARHVEQVARDRLALVALLGSDAGIGAGRVDQRDDGQAEALRQSASAAAPCDSPRVSACRSCAARAPWCRALSAARSA